MKNTLLLACVAAILPAATEMMLMRAGSKTDPERWMEVYESLTDDVRNHPLVENTAKQINVYKDFEGTWEGNFGDMASDLRGDEIEKTLKDILG